LIELELPAAKSKALMTYQFLTLKPLLLVINVPEDKIQDDEEGQRLEHEFGCPTVQLSVEIESEIEQLSAGERKEYLAALGITQPAIAKMSQLAFRGLGYISFFTVGEDEVRAWPVADGASAVVAGGTIHSDIAKGFVRVEMFKYRDLISAGSEAKLKEQGKFHLKGKDYLIEDGDILSFRFNV
jgi:ribosome-binding ATPase YchF (GTP1/OBG family)